MSTELWLQEPRVALDEAGAALHYDFGREQAQTMGQRLARGELTLTNALWEPVGGVVMGQPDLRLDDTLHDQWLPAGAGWRGPGYEPRALCLRGEGVWRRAMAQVEPEGAWSLTSRQVMPQGQSGLVQFLSYAGHVEHRRLTMDFGGVWRLELDADGWARLLRQDGDGWRRRATFRWLDRPHLAPERHTLWIYEVGPKLVVRGLDVLESDASTGVAVWDDDPEPDADGRGSHHALHRGPWRFEGSGRIVLGHGVVRWPEGEVVVETRAAEPAGGYLGVTQPVHHRAWGWSPEPSLSPTLAVWDQADAAYPVWPQAPATTPAPALRWRLAWHNRPSAPYFLTSLSLATATTVRADGNVGTDLLALPGVADRVIELSREGDWLHERLAVELLSSARDLAAYCQPNMSVRYVADGLTRFRGLTTGAEWRVVAHAEPVVGQLALQAVGLDKVFAKAVWPGGRPFDGRRLTDCLVDIAVAAGLTPGEYDIVDDPFVLPSPPVGEPPSLVYRVGAALADMLDDLRRAWFGDWLTCYWNVEDGRWVVTHAPTGSGEPAATYYTTEAAARAAGVPGRVVLSGSYEEVLDESRLANVVTVIGQAPDGSALTARCIDWGSIRDRAARNYVGEAWPLTVVDPALTSQQAVNQVCRGRFEQVRWARVYAQFRSVRVDLRPGDLVRLVGAGYGGLYRLRGLSLEQRADGDAADPQGRATYSLEKLR